MPVVVIPVVEGDGADGAASLRGLARQGEAISFVLQGAEKGLQFRNPDEKLPVGAGLRRAIPADAVNTEAEMAVHFIPSLRIDFQAKLRVRNSVYMTSTNNIRRPWTMQSIIRAYYFIGLRP